MSYRPAHVSTELSQIAAAQSGDEAAKTALFVQYRPAIENYARNADGYLDADAFQNGCVIFLETVEQYEPARDPSAMPSLAPLLRANLSHSRSGNVSTAAFTIPGRTFRLYRQIMTAAENDAVAADALLDVAKSDGGFSGMMSHATFARAHAVLQTRTSDDGTTTDAGSVLGAGEGYRTTDAFARFEANDALLGAMHALSADEREVVLRAFGFVDVATLPADCVSDSLIAADLGLSRAKVQRLRTSAMSKLREQIDIF